MDNNKKLAIVSVVPFADRATELGCYSKTQRYNFGTAWAVLLEHLGAVGLTQSATIEELEPKIADALKERGRNKNVNAESLRAYQARIKKLLEDFVKWNGGDFMKWKEEIAKTNPTDDAKSQKRRKVTRQRSNSGDGEDIVDSITYPLFAGDGKDGKISIGRDLTEEQIDRIWAQLDAIKTLVRAQSGVIDPKSK
jgi:hypothetical protein